jgi:hypothetical protein
MEEIMKEIDDSIRSRLRAIALNDQYLAAAKERGDEKAVSQHQDIINHFESRVALLQELRNQC